MALSHFPDFLKNRLKSENFEKEILRTGTIVYLATIFQDFLSIGNQDLEILIFANSGSRSILVIQVLFVAIEKSL